MSDNNMELIGRLVKTNEEWILVEWGIELRLDYEVIKGFYPERAEKYADSSFEEFVKSWFHSIIVEQMPQFKDLEWIDVLVTAGLKDDEE